MNGFEPPSSPRHLVVILGGAVAGSEAAALCAERGALAVVLEQNDRPFGKIEDGLPRWHAKLQQREYARIGDNLSRPGVLFVPSTALGRDITVDTLVNEWQASAVLLASGAWRDRPLPVEGVDAFVGKGLMYQNPFVHWYNHYPDAGYAGPHYEVPDGAIVVGGGLASIDVVKIINFQLYKRALRARGVQVTTLELEHAGIPKTLAAHGLTQAELGVRGTTLFYRRSKREMPLASAPPNATAEQLAKMGDVREKLMDKVSDKYLVRFEGNHAPIAPLSEAGRLTGLRFQRTHTVDGKLVAIEGDEIDVQAPLVISSIGSVPEPVPGLPMNGELIDFDDWQTGRVRGFDQVFGLGNALTGKGNIKESRKNAGEITAQVLERYLGIADEALSETDAADLHHDARIAAEATLAEAFERAPLLPEQVQKVYDAVSTHWARSGYDGDYDAWIQQVMPQHEES